MEKGNNGQNKDSTSIGDNTEIYITNLLTNSKEFEFVDRVGQIGDKTDIILTLKSGERKSLQVKTIYLSKPPELYSMTNDCKYLDDMLIVMVNTERTRFALEFAKNMTQSNPKFPFNYPDSIHKNIMFTDEKEF